MFGLLATQILGGKEKLIVSGPLTRASNNVHVDRSWTIHVSKQIAPQAMTWDAFSS